jgi:SsrA-binding protein
MMNAAKSKNDKTSSGRVAISNRKAYHEFTVLESLEVGIALTGTEIKSLRKGRASLNEAHARIEKGEMWLYGLNISPYEAGTYNNHDPLRARRLLLHKKQIIKFHQAVQEKGLTLIPLRLYFARCWVKIELGLCQGKKLHDKRDALKAKQSDREMQREVKNVNFKNQ